MPRTRVDHRLSFRNILADVITLSEWIMKDAKIPPSRIVILAQSSGTAVSLLLIHHLITQPEPAVVFRVALPHLPTLNH
ncbi:hypothetical protein F5X98DRAFT_349737 [Xylaria grammica]|nr:hypothetical protein F5X98DRAFT_349737 [Xylaria grammica]